MKNTIKKIARFILQEELEAMNSGIKSLTEINDHQAQLYQGCIETVKEQAKNIQRARTELDTKIREISNLNVQVVNATTTELDRYCMVRHAKVSKVYKDKIIIGEVMMECNLLEMFLPKSAVIEKARKSISKPTDKLKWYSKVTNLVHNRVTWTDDGRYDNYFYPNYTWITKKGDCDDHSFLQGSIEPEIGVAFGFFIKKDGNRYGHAFGVAAINDKLWILDAVGNIVKGYTPNDQYYIHYIITPNAVYQLDGTVEFGEILWS